MSFTWGPAIDAEVSYRQQRVRADYHRAPRKHFLFHHDKANRHPAEAEPVPALSAIPLPHYLGVNPMWGTAGLTASAGVAGWVEMLLLRASLNRRIGRTGLPSSYVAILWFASAMGAAAGWGVKLALPRLHPAVAAIGILGAYGVVFLGIAVAFRIPEVQAMRRLRR